MFIEGGESLNFLANYYMEVGQIIGRSMVVTNAYFAGARRSHAAPAAPLALRLRSSSEGEVNSKWSSSSVQEASTELLLLRFSSSSSSDTDREQRGCFTSR